MANPIDEISENLVENAPKAEKPADETQKIPDENQKNEDENQKNPDESEKKTKKPRKPGSGRVSNEEKERRTKEQENLEKAELKKIYDRVGMQISDGFVYSNVLFFGKEFGYLDLIKDESGRVVKNEREEMVTAASHLCEAHDIRAVPLWFELSIILTGFYSIRLAQEPVRERMSKKFGKFFGWIWGGVKKIFNRSKKIEKNALPDTR